MKGGRQGKAGRKAGIPPAALEAEGDILPDI